MLNLFRRPIHPDRRSVDRELDSIDRNFFTQRSRHYLEQTPEEAEELTDECRGIIHYEDHRDGTYWACRKMEEKGFLHHRTKKNDKNGDVCFEDPTQTGKIKTFWQIEQY